MSGNNIKTITFYDNHIPVLEDGKYDINVSQTIVVDGSTYNIEGTNSDPQLSFRVEGPKFSLENSLIHTVFPPKGGKGDFRSCLPTLSLTRSTLPWERTPFEGSPDNVNPPWLFLLLIDETENDIVIEKNNSQLTDICNLKLPSGNPMVATDDVKNYPSTLNYIQLDETLKSIIPSTINELQYLSYARIKNEISNFPSEEHAVLLCNRLPQPGKNSTVYLISLENNYSGNLPSSTFTGITQTVIDTTTKISKSYFVFPYLYKWNFHAIDDKFYVLDEDKIVKINNTIAKLNDALPAPNPLYTLPDFSSLPLGQLYKSTGELKSAIPQAITSPKIISIIESIAEIPGSTFHGMLANLKGGFSALSLSPTSDDITSTGSSQLNYLQTKDGPSGEQANVTQAWYRGPLAATDVELGGILTFPDITKDINANGSIQLVLNLDFGVWDSSDESVAVVTNGIITAVGVGNCTINFSNDEANLLFNISITQASDKSFQISLENGPSNQADKYNVKSQIISSFESGSLTSSDNTIATVDNGLVTANSTGKTGMCKINCSDDIVAITFNIEVTNSILKTKTMPTSPANLVLYDNANQINDISYSAAFELGRLTALDDVSFTKEFYKWKSQTAMVLRQEIVKNKDTSHLPNDNSKKIAPIPSHVVEKFTAWKYLEGIPYRYLVPQTNMLPEESIRFFRVDNNWINSFLCGAFSIGHTAKVDFSPYLKGLLLGSDVKISGILINSLVVSGWPDFMIDLQPSKNVSEAQLLRKSNLDENIRLYIVSGTFDQLEFYLHHGKTHSGFMINTVNENLLYTKKDGTVILDPNPNETNYIIDMVNLAGKNKLNVGSIAEFGAIMLESVPKIVFKIE